MLAGRPRYEAKLENSSPMTDHPEILFLPVGAFLLVGFYDSEEKFGSVVAQSGS